VEKKVSVIMPNYNGAEFLRACFESILAQTHRNIQIIFVDGASKDNSVDIAKEFASRHTNIQWISEPDRGQADAINKGLRLATGAYVTWLNSDDRLTPDAIATGLAALEAHADCVLVYGSVINVHADGTFLYLNAGQAFPKNELVYYDFVPQTGALFRRLPDLAVNPELHWSFDWAFWIELSRRGEIKRLNHLMGYCIIQGDYDRKSNVLTVERTAELLSVTRKYAPGFDPRVLFVYLALFLGYALKPFSLVYKNYYFQVMRSVGRLHAALYPKEKGLML
jgi:glycosyltransferase involved in cell wall biosynthesis